MIDLRSQNPMTATILRQNRPHPSVPWGCQWDQAQTHQSIRRNFLEEAYEVAGGD